MQREGTNSEGISFLKKLAIDNAFLDAYVEAIVSNIRLAALDKDYRITWVNERFCRLTQYNGDELIGKKVDQLDLAPVGKEDFKTIFSIVSKGNPWSGEIRHQAKDGSMYWAKINLLPIKDNKGKVESYLMLNSNITATKKALEEKSMALEHLTRSEARYRALVENQTDLISLCSADGTRVYVNASYCRFMGKHVDELLGTNIRELPLPGVSPRNIQKVFKLTPGSPEITELLEIASSNGGKVWFSLVVKGIFDTHGNLFEILTIGRNVTDLKHAELRKGNYIDSLERIAFMTSHNVRGPIASMLGLLDLLRMNAIHTDEWHQVLGNFRECIKDLDFYTRELGAFIHHRQLTK